MKEIVSDSNKLYKLFVKLLSAKKYRLQEKSYLAEGRNTLDVPAPLVKAYIVRYSDKNKVKHWGLEEEKVVLLADRLFKRLSNDPSSQGLITWMEMRDHFFLTEKWQWMENVLYLALEDIQDPGNLGTMIRTAEAAGVKAVFCSSGTVDLYHPKVIKAAASSLSRMEVVTDTKLEKLLAIAKNRGIPSFAATPIKATEYDKADYRQGGIILIGNEGNGLSTKILNLATERIYIPMCGQIESLNAAISASILLFEARKTRMDN